MAQNTQRDTQRETRSDTIRFRLPDVDTPGALGILAEMGAKLDSLRNLQTRIALGSAPDPADVYALVDTLTFFALDEPDKAAVRDRILHELSLTEIATAVTALVGAVKPGASMPAVTAPGVTAPGAALTAGRSAG